MSAQCLTSNQIIEIQVVKEEYLYYTPNGRQTKIFERKFNNFTVGSSNKFKGKLNSCKEVLKENKLLLSCAANFSIVEEIIDAYKFFFRRFGYFQPP